MDNQNMDKYVRIGVNRYEVRTLENNWNEDRFDVKYIKELKPTLNNYDYAYETTYLDMTSYINRSNEQQEKANYIKNLSRVKAHPGHQVELSIDGWRPMYATNYTISYVDPKLMTGNQSNTK